MAGFMHENVEIDLLYAMPYIGGGASGWIYALDDNNVIKVATGSNHSDQDLEIECRIYERLRGHPRILRFRVESRGLILERLVCPLREHLLDLHRQGDIPSDETLTKWTRQILNGLWYIHSRGVLQADIGCHNLLLDKNDNLKFCDFGGSSIDGEAPTVRHERRGRHPTIEGPNLATELFALGTTLYEISTAEPPYPQLRSATGIVQNLYAAGAFPSVDHLMFGEIILKCWKGYYESTVDIAFELQDLLSSPLNFSTPCSLSGEVGEVRHDAS